MNTAQAYLVPLKDFSTDSKIVFTEKRKKMTFLNPEHESYCKVHVDGDVISSGLRCDYMLVRQYDEAEEYYVELKGSDIPHAISQLQTTIDRIGLKTRELKRVAFIIASKVYPQLNTQIQNGIASFRKKYNAKLIVTGQSHYEYRLNG